MIFLLLITDEVVKLRLQRQENGPEAAEVAHNCDFVLCRSWSHLMHHHIWLILLDARQDGQDRPLKIAGEHVCDDRLLGLILTALIITIFSHFVELLKDAQNNPALFEEGEQEELEWFLDVDHEKFKLLALILPLLCSWQ